VEALLTKTMLLLRLDANGRVLEASPSDLVPVGTLLSDAVLPGDRAAVEAMLQAARRGEPAWGAVTLHETARFSAATPPAFPASSGRAVGCCACEQTMRYRRSRTRKNSSAGWAVS
jgi:hypothetical protein